MPKLSARSLKCTVVLDPVEISELGDPPTPRVLLHIAVSDCGTVVADIATTSLRKVQNAINEHGADGVAVILQGKLASGNRIVEAGLVTQVKAPKPVAAAEVA
jgi:hypothetical protein